MPTDTTDLFIEPCDLNSETAWEKLIIPLRSLARSLVYSYHVPCWYGQEEDMIEDIVQETARRIVERVRKAEQGEAESIRSPRGMITITAQNYCNDLRRRDHRLLHMGADTCILGARMYRDRQAPLFDAICESIDQEQLLTQVAQEIACFPEKQRTALLIDLANRMSFDVQPTPLQDAFLEAGIRLEQYRQPLPVDKRKRNQHISLLNYAIKRITRLPCVQEYITGTKQIPHTRKRRLTQKTASLPAAQIQSVS